MKLWYVATVPVTTAAPATASATVWGLGRSLVIEFGK
jgi:hypothetical protein